jgi:ABC-2 type transport system permease protein
MTWQGIRTVAVLELRQRVRTSRTRWVLLAWVIVIYGIIGLSWLATRTMTPQDQGTVVYSVTTFFLLGLSLLVVPSLSASAVNGDREHGVLATLQTTLLSPAEIALGKLLASWAASGAFLAIAAPALIVSLVSGGVTISSLLLALLTTALVLAVVCAIGLMFSTVAARTVSSVVLTYLTVGFLVFGTAILFGVTSPLTEQTAQVLVRQYPQTAELTENGTLHCVDVREERDVYHTERTWWMLAFNPFVIVSDAAPAVRSTSVLDPLRAISDGARSARRGPTEPIIECRDEWMNGGMQTENQSLLTGTDLTDEGPVWPLGFGALALLGAGATTIAVRRLRTPVRTLPRGVRIA